MPPIPGCGPPSQGCGLCYRAASSPSLQLCVLGRSCRRPGVAASIQPNPAKVEDTKKQRLASPREAWISAAPAILYSVRNGHALRHPGASAFARLPRRVAQPSPACSGWHACSSRIDPDTHTGVCPQGCHLFAIGVRRPSVWPVHLTCAWRGHGRWALKAPGRRNGGTRALAPASPRPHRPAGKKWPRPPRRRVRLRRSRGRVIPSSHPGSRVVRSSGHHPRDVFYWGRWPGRRGDVD